MAHDPQGNSEKNPKPQLKKPDFVPDAMLDTFGQGTFGQGTVDEDKRDQYKSYQLFYDKNNNDMVVYCKDDISLTTKKPKQNATPHYIFEWKLSEDGSYTIAESAKQRKNYQNSDFDLSDESAGFSCKLPVGDDPSQEESDKLFFADFWKLVSSAWGDHTDTDPDAEVFKLIQKTHSIKTRAVPRKFFLRRDSSGRMFCYAQPQPGQNVPIKPLFEMYWSYDSDAEPAKKLTLQTKPVDNNVDANGFDINSQVFEVNVTSATFKDDILAHLTQHQPEVDVDAAAGGAAGGNGKAALKITKKVASTATPVAAPAAPNAAVNKQESLDDFLYRSARNKAQKRFMSAAEQQQTQREIRAHVESLRHSKWNQFWKKALMFIGVTDGMYFSGLLGGLSEAPDKIMLPADKIGTAPTSVVLFSIAFGLKILEFVGRIGDTVTSKNINMGKIKTLLIPVLELVAMGIAIYGGQTFLAGVTVAMPALHLSAVMIAPIIFSVLLGGFSLYNLGMAIWLGIKSFDDKKYSKIQRQGFANEAAGYAQKSFTFALVTGALMMMMIFAKMLPGAGASTVHILGIAAPVLPLMAAAVAAIAVINLVNTISLMSKWRASSEQTKEQQDSLRRQFLVSLGKTLMYTAITAGVVLLCVFGGPLGVGALVGIGAALTIGVPLLFEVVIPKAVMAIKNYFSPPVAPKEKTENDYELEVRHDYRKDLTEEEKKELESHYSRDARKMKADKTLPKQMDEYHYYKHSDIQSTGLAAHHAKQAFDDLKAEISGHGVLRDKLTHKGSFIFWKSQNLFGDKYGALKLLQAYQEKFFDIVNNLGDDSKKVVDNNDASKMKFKVTLNYNNIHDTSLSVDFYFNDLNELREKVEDHVNEKFKLAYQATSQFIGKVQSYYRQADEILLTMGKVKLLDPQGLEDEFKIKPMQIQP